MPQKDPRHFISNQHYCEATAQIKDALGINSRYRRTAIPERESKSTEDQSCTVPAWCAPSTTNYGVFPHPPTDPAQFAANPLAYPHFGFFYIAPSAPGETPSTFMQPVQPVSAPEFIQSFPVSCMPNYNFFYHQHMHSQSTHAFPSLYGHHEVPLSYLPMPQNSHQIYQRTHQFMEKKLTSQKKRVIPIIDPATGAQIDIRSLAAKVNTFKKSSTVSVMGRKSVMNRESVKDQTLLTKVSPNEREPIGQGPIAEPVDIKRDGLSAAMEEDSTTEEEVTDEDSVKDEAESITSIEESGNEEEKVNDESPTTERDTTEISSNAPSKEAGANAQDKGKGCAIQPERIQYSKMFLLRFRERCKETTADLSFCTTKISSASDAEQGWTLIQQQSGSNRFPSNYRSSNSGRNACRGSNKPQVYLGSQSWHRNEYPRPYQRPRPIEQQMHENPAEEQQVQSHPLNRSENCWMPSKYRESNKAQLSSDEQLQQKVKALLNKLSPTNFDSISTQIFEYAKDTHTLKTVVNMTFEKACDEPCFSTLWAKLCRKMYDEANSNKFVDPTTLDRDGHPMKGVILFRQYLVKRCQETYERGWSSATYEMLSDEYYQATKAKRQALGLVTFIGELFKQNILSFKIVQTCLQGLTNAPESISDDVIETICKLLETVGMAMDIHPHSKAWLDAYMQRVQDIMNTCQELSTRVKFKVMDLNDLRKRRWVTKRSM